jgi:hypothetical protein
MFNYEVTYLGQKTKIVENNPARFVTCLENLIYDHRELQPTIKITMTVNKLTYFHSYTLDPQQLWDWDLIENKYKLNRYLKKLIEELHVALVKTFTSAHGLS